MRRTIAIFFLLLPVMAANAQALQDEAEQEPRRYTVEMIVFTYAEDIGSGGEVFVADPPPDDTQSLDAAIERCRASAGCTRHIPRYRSSAPELDRLHDGRHQELASTG